MKFRVAALAIALLTVTSHAASPDLAALPKLHVDRTRVAIAGLSAGAYMAEQAQLAYPGIFHGAALIAGGPYDCARDSVATAVTTCMKGSPAPPDSAALAKLAQERAAKGEIGPLTKLAGGKVYILHGKQDPVIAESVAHATVDFYAALKAAVPELSSLSVTWDGSREFSHTFPTEAAGIDCDKVGAPFLGKCDFDGAGAVFHALFGASAHKVAQARGKLQRFDQKALLPDGRDAALADEGVLYVPPACAKGRRCGVLVALHGCLQNVDSVGEAFVKEAGFNRWADAYDVAVLYPQTRSGVAANPKACWDWFGYTGPDYATRDGVQLRWLVAAVTALGRPPY
jgi:poly(3-hydroxybutyrate) depolymerase